MDSSFVKGQIAQDDGTYTFDNVAAGTYWLDINRVGLDKKRTAIFTLTPSVGRKEMPVTTLGEAAQLKEVEVVTKRPFLEQQIDRTIVNVANSIIGSGRNRESKIRRFRPAIVFGGLFLRKIGAQRVVAKIEKPSAVGKRLFYINQKTIV